MRLSLVPIFTMLLAVTACSNDIVSQPQTGIGSVAAMDAAAYKLMTEDKVRITVFGEDTLTGDYVIAADGTIAFPLIETIKAAGLTTDTLRQQLALMLSQKYITNPRITVAITEYRPFYILGEVNGAGQYPYRPGMTVVAAIATARGFTYRADKSRVLIQHQGDAAENLYPLTPSLMILPGDTIRIKERFF